MFCGVVIASAGALGGGQGRGARQTQARQIASRENVALFPPALAGGGGWCLRELNGSGCPTFAQKLRRGPILLEEWTTVALPPAPPVATAIVLTTSRVAAVALAGRTPVPTRAQPGLPSGLRAAVLELRGTAHSGQGGAHALTGEIGPFVALDRSGRRVHENFATQAPLNFSAPNRSFSGAGGESPGLCTLEVDGLDGNVAGGTVVTDAPAHNDVFGRELLNCIDLEYRFGGALLDVYALVDAEHPGSPPGPLPAAKPVLHDPGVLQAPGVGGQAVARRTAGAWLVVSEGVTPAAAFAGGHTSITQRVEVLEHLHAQIRPY